MNSLRATQATVQAFTQAILANAECADQAERTMQEAVDLSRFGHITVIEAVESMKSLSAALERYPAFPIQSLFSLFKPSYWR